MNKLKGEQDFSNLQQEVLRLTQRLIALENKVGGLDPVFLNHSARLDDHDIKLTNALTRVGVLEDARRRQIAFNTSVSSKLSAPPTGFLEKIWSKKQ